MKKNVLYILLCIISFVCCTESNDEPIPLLTVNEKIDYSQSVSYNEICQLVNVTNRTRAGNLIEEIECYVDEECDTLLYLINKGNDQGWTIYSTDKRIPSILAECSVGSLSFKNLEDPLETWINIMAEDVKVVKHTATESLDITSQEISDNLNFWNSLSKPDEFITKTRARVDPVPVGGHYELDAMYQYEEVMDSVSHLTETEWNQGSSYNMYCPLKSNSSTERVPAGCVPVAAAQMLYFLHNNLGRPVYAPSEVYCYGDVNNYSIHVGEMSTSVWNDMQISLSGAAAKLITYVGLLVDVSYGNDGSGANAEDLVNSVFAPLGISCTYTSYNETTMKQSLEQGMPLIIKADRTNVFGFTWHGHTFIIDGYKRHRIKTTYVYKWVYEDDPETDGIQKEVPFVEDKVVVQYSTPYITKIKMNWGMQNRSHNDIWFTPSGEWVIHASEGDRNYNYSRHMIHNFQISE